MNPQAASFFEKEAAFFVEGHHAEAQTHKHLKPGEAGTVRLVERFGAALLCVRYRYDAIRDMRTKTA